VELPLYDLIEYAIVGKAKLDEKMMDRTEFTEKMIYEFGEGIRDWMGAIYQQSLDMFDFTTEQMNRLQQQVYKDAQFVDVEYTDNEVRTRKFENHNESTYEAMVSENDTDKNNNKEHNNNRFKSSFQELKGQLASLNFKENRYGGMEGSYQGFHFTVTESPLNIVIIYYFIGGRTIMEPTEIYLPRNADIQLVCGHIVGIIEAK
jgi:hypothetical protein